MKLLAYGSLTNSNQMPEGAIRLGPAVLHGWRWEMMCFANVFRSPGNSFTGILWEIDEDMLSEFDRREGYPNFYDRMTAEVDFRDRTEQAMVYFMTEVSRNHYAQSVPSEYYLDMVEQGYATDNLMPPNYHEHRTNS